MGIDTPIIVVGTVYCPALHSQPYYIGEGSSREHLASNINHCMGIRPSYRQRILVIALLHSHAPMVFLPCNRARNESYGDYLTPRRTLKKCGVFFYYSFDMSERAAIITVIPARETNKGATNMTLDQQRIKAHTEWKEARDSRESAFGLLAFHKMQLKDREAMAEAQELYDTRKATTSYSLHLYRLLFTTRSESRKFGMALFNKSQN